MMIKPRPRKRAIEQKFIEQATFANQLVYTRGFPKFICVEKGKPLTKETVSFVWVRKIRHQNRPRTRDSGFKKSQLNMMKIFEELGLKVVRY